MKLSVGSNRRVLVSPMNTGSVRFSVPKPRSESLVAMGRPGSSSRSGMPSSGRNRRRHRLDAQRLAVHRVGLTVAGVLALDGAVVVQGGSPEHAAVGHHALSDLQRFLGMAIGSAAGDVRDAQVAGVDEANVIRRLV